MTYYGFNPLIVKGYTIGLERIADMEDELKVLHTEHYGETEALYMQEEVDCDYDRWRASEAAKQFVVFTVRTAERMVGYLQFYVFHDMHSKDVLQAREDAFFLTKSERGGGIASKLLGYAEQCLKQLGCRYVGMTSKGPVGGPDIGNFLERKGYRPVAMYYSKLLED